MKEELKEKILKYLNDTKYDRAGRNFVLKVLDNKYRTYYTGVTLNYITYTLLKAKYKKKDVAQVLFELHQDKELNAIRCPDIQNVVFECKRCPYGTFGDNYSGDNTDPNNIRGLQYFKNYLRIKDE